MLFLYNGRHMVKNLIFDLDGTLLDTLPGITLAINEALAECGYPYSFTEEETKSLIGGGADRLVRKALKDKGNDEDAFAALKKAYMPLYRKFQETNTGMFSGLEAVLRAFHSEGKRLFVVSNKPDPLAKDAVKKFLPPLFAGVTGQKEGFPPKPNPASTFSMMKEFGLNPLESVYIGDSHFDVETAHNAHLRCILVTWGYGDYKEPLICESDRHVSSPTELYSVVQSL